MKNKLLMVILIIILAQTALAGEMLLKQTLFEGESRNYDVGGYVYEVKLLAVFDTQLKAQFEVNGESTKALSEDESFRLSDGAVIQVRDVMPQEAGDGLDLVQFNFFPVSHPEAAAQTVPAAVQEKASPPAEQPVPSSVSEPKKEISAAPPGEAKIDITRKKPTTSWWESLLTWLRNLFK